MVVVCGNAIGNRLKVPQPLKEEPLEKEDYAFRRSGNMLMVRYKDKKEIYFLSTIHEIKTEKLLKRGRGQLSPSKLSLVNDYNKYMGVVDRNEALIGNYTCVRKTFTRTVKVVMHFLEEAVPDAFISFDKNNAGKAHFMNFKLEWQHLNIYLKRQQSLELDLIHQKICMSTLQLVDTFWNLFLQQKRNKIPGKDVLSLQKKECARKVGINVKTVQITLVCVLLRVLSCIITDLYINIKKHEHSFVISLFQVNYNVFISFWKRNILPKNTTIFIFLKYPWSQD